MWLYYFLAALLLLQSLLSLRGGFRYLRFFHRELNRAPADFTPHVSVIVPCRGVDQGLRDNLSSLFWQSYPAYEIVFVLEDQDDSALKVIEEVRWIWEQVWQPTSRIVFAGRAESCGQKVHNLRVAVAEISTTSEVIVFVDTDARPQSDWLRSLVAPLFDAQIGATTGYRWFVPTERGRVSSHVRSVWNASIASALGDNTRRNFCWGGSTAIRRAIFDKLNMLDEWRGALSDDYALTRALQRAGLAIKFVPACLVASHDDCTWRELFEFTTRQLKITRVYAPHLWRIVLVSNLIFCAVFYGGVIITASRALRGESFITPLAVLLSVFALGACKAQLRLAAINLALAREDLRMGIASRLAHLSLWTLTAALYLYNALAAALSRRIKWRGITYEMKSPTETIVIAQPTSIVDRD
jgi:cellulose synthase/poly-beta-1,6-N-acetylglucosamine synthase-like glycosyltransferase